MLELVRSEPAYKVYEASLAVEPVSLWFFVVDPKTGEEHEVTELTPRRFRSGYLVSIQGSAVKLPISEDTLINIYREIAE